MALLTDDLPIDGLPKDSRTIDPYWMVIRLNTVIPPTHYLPCSLA